MGIRKFLLSFLAIAPCLSAIAQTDVTSQYIVNPSFEYCEVPNSGHYATDNVTTASGGNAQDYSSTGWNVATSTGFNAGSVIVYGGAQKFCGVDAPASGPTGGGAQGLAISVGWSGTLAYQTEGTVTLPAGTYTFSADVYNTNTATQITSKFGFVASSSEYLSTTTSVASGSWTTESVTFTLTATTTGHFQVGAASGNVGSDTNAFLYFDNLKLTYTAGSASEISWGSEPVDGETYYLYNVGSRSFFSRGSSWNTHAVCQPHEALAVTLTTSGSGYKLVTDYGGTGNHLTGDSYVDGNERTQGYQWGFTEVDATNHIYKLSLLNGTESGSYFYKNASTIECLVGADTGDAYSQWQLVKTSDYQYMPSLATSTNPIDVNLSGFITNPNFDDNVSGWSGTAPARGGNVQDGNGRETPEFNPNAEHFNKNFDTYQTISGLTPGLYRLEVQGFYRYGGYADAASARDAGTEQKYAKIYAGDKEADLMSILDDAANATASLGTNGASVTFGSTNYVIPNDMAQASVCFTDGLYNNVLNNILVGSDGSLKIGLKKSTTQGADWTIFDNFRLYYLGPDMSSLETELAEAVAAAETLEATLSGTILSDLQAVVSTYNTTWTTAQEYSTAILNIKAATTAASQLKESSDIYNRLVNFHTVNAGRFNETSELYTALSTVAASLAASYSTASEYDNANMAYYNAAVAAIDAATEDINVSPLYVTNYSFETGDLTGWTYNEGNDTGVKANSGIYVTSGIDGNYVFNTWDAAGTLDKYVSQTVTGLPEGTYYLKALHASDAGNNMTLSIGTATTTHAAVSGVAAFDEVTTTMVAVAANGSVTIKANGTNWYKVDNFQLMYSLVDLEHYTYNATSDDWVTGDVNRVTQENISYDATAGTITLNPSTEFDEGVKNVCLKLKAPYYINTDERYLYIKAENVLAENDKSNLWYLASHLQGNLVASRHAKDDTYTYLVWDLNGLEGSSVGSGNTTLYTGAEDFNVLFGLTAETQGTASVIDSIKFVTGIPQAILDWEEAYEDLEELITNANTVLARMADADGTFAAAIAAAQLVLDDTEATTSELQNALATVYAAFSAVLPTETEIVDVTEMLIVNPSFETGDLTGWTAETAGLADVAVRTTTNATYATTGSVGSYLFNSWGDGFAGGSISQTLTNVPNAKYKVSALMATSGSTLNLTAGSVSAEVASDGTYSSFTLVKTDEIEVTTGTLDITASANDGTNNRFMKADYFRMYYYPDVTVTEETPLASKFTGEEIAAGTYYLYNPAADAFLCGGNTSGTHTSVNDVGIPVTLTANADGTYAISTAPTYTDSYLYYSSADDDYFVDGAVKTRWTLTPSASDSKQFTLLNTDMMLVWDGESATSVSGAYGSVTQNAYWQLVTRDERISKIGTADDDTYNNASFYMYDPDFSRNTAVFWNNVVKGGKEANYNAEKFNGTLNTYQNLGTFSKAGLYRVELQGFYRNGDFALGWQGDTFAGTRRHKGLESLLADAYVIVNDGTTDTEYSIPIRSIFGDSLGFNSNLVVPESWVEGTDYVLSEGIKSSALLWSYGYVPRSMSMATSFYDAGFYNDNVFYIYVPANANVTIGVKKESTATNDWLDFDHMRIYYVGDENAAVAEAYNNYQAMQNYAYRFIHNNYTHREMRDQLYMKYFIDTYYPGESYDVYGANILNEKFADYITAQHDASAELMAKFEAGTATAAELASLTDLLNEQTEALELETERYYLRYAIAEFHYFHQSIRAIYNANASNANETAVQTRRAAFTTAIGLADQMQSIAVGALNNSEATLENCRSALRAIYGTNSYLGENWTQFDMYYDTPYSVSEDAVTAPLTYRYTDPDDNTVTDYTDLGLENYLRKVMLDYVQYAEPASNNNFDLTCLFTKPELDGIEVWSYPYDYNWASDVNLDGVHLEDGGHNNFNIHGGNQEYEGTYPSFIERYYKDDNALSAGWHLYQKFYLTPGRYKFNALAFACDKNYEQASNVYITAAAVDNTDASTYPKHKIISPTLSDNTVYFTVAKEGEYKIGIYSTDDLTLWDGMRQLHLYKIPEVIITEYYTYMPGYVPETGSASLSATRDNYFDFASEAEMYFYRTFPEYKQTISDWTSSSDWSIKYEYDSNGYVSRAYVAAPNGSTEGTAYDNAISAFNASYENYWSTLCVPFDMSPEELKFVFGDNAVVNWYTGSSVQLFNGENGTDDGTGDYVDDGAIVDLNFYDPVEAGEIDQNSDNAIVRTNIPCLIMIGVDPGDLPYEDSNVKVGKWFTSTNLTAKRIDSYDLPFAAVDDALAVHKNYYLGTVRPELFNENELNLEHPNENITVHKGGVSYNPDNGSFSFIGVYDGNGTYEGAYTTKNMEDGPFFEVPQPDKTDASNMTASYYIASHTSDGTTDTYLDGSHFRYVPTGTVQKMWGFRGYFEYKGASVAVAGGKIRINVNKSGATDIQVINSEGRIVDADAKKAGVFNLQGVKLGDDESVLKNLPKGVYIVNGKKVVLK